MTAQVHDVVGSPGEHIASAAERLVDVARRRGAPARLVFNDIELTALPESTAEEIVALFNDKLVKASAAYRASPEGHAAAVARITQLEQAQRTYDAAIEDMKALRFGDEGAVIDWLCRIQDASDTIGVERQNAHILTTFAANGYAPGVYCGPAFDEDNREVFARWLIGQALDGIQSLGAIHGMVHKFAEDWKVKFAPPQG